MKVLVKDFLNVRVGAPSVNAPCYQYLAPGSEIEVDGNFYQGDFFDGSNIWLKDLVGNYYWRGGFQIAEQPVAPPSPATAFDLSSQIKLRNPLPKTNGDKITIAVLDSGIDISHPALASCVKEKIDFIKAADATITNDHGTRVAGIIAAHDAAFRGLASESKLLDYRVINNKGFTNSKALIDSLKHMIEKKINVDVVNMSLDVDRGIIPLIEPLITTLADQGCVFIVAGGTAAAMNKMTKLKRPLFVGVFEEADASKTRQEYHISFLNSPVKSTGIFSKTPYTSISEDSAYTAVVTGIASKFLSSNVINKKDRFEKIKAYLQSNAFKESEHSPVESFKPLKA